MRTLLSFVAVLLVSAAVPRAAQACGRGGGSYSGFAALYVGALVIGGGAVVGDFAFTTHDLSVDKSSLGAGVGETVLMAPQVVLGVALVSNIRDAPGRAVAVVYTAWVSALLVHGIYAIANASDQGSQALLRAAPSAPARPGAALSLTFVDVGQRSAPGLGLVGRF